MFHIRYIAFAQFFKDLHLFCALLPFALFQIGVGQTEMCFGIVGLEFDGFFEFANRLFPTADLGIYGPQGVVENRSVGLEPDGILVLLNSFLVFFVSRIDHTEPITGVSHIGINCECLDELLRGFVVLALAFIGHTQIVLEPAVFRGQLHSLAMLRNSGCQLVLIRHDSPQQS